MQARARRSGSIVTLEPSGALLPSACACCGGEAARSDVARLSSGGHELIVGYCDECRKHQGSERARRLSAVLASSLLGLACALLLPLASPPRSLVALGALTFVAALLPVVVVLFWRRRSRPGHAADGAAVRFVGAREVLCADERWALELARLNGTTRTLAPWRESRFSRVMLAPPLLSPLLALLLANALAPVVRVVNLSGDEIVVEVDGVRRANVLPTSIESPAAGKELRVAAGEHDLSARSLDGRMLETAHVVIDSGRAHLFAPASEGHCFWLETTAYGRTGKPEPPRDGAKELPVREPLEGPPHFWSLPTDLGGWFSAPPEAATTEARWTGGAITVLRYGPCEILR